MKASICAMAAIALLVLFSAVNLFLPFGLLVLGALVALGYSCRYFGRSRNRECALGFC